VAIVATDAGGTREIFPPDCNAARLVPADDVLALADAVGDLLANAARRQILADNARKRVEKAFDLDRAVAGLVRHYGEVSR
jgi:glycosyltransferase involved in cell wall biosynthesis